MTPHEHSVVLHLRRRLPVRLPKLAPFNPAANRFFVDDQPVEPLLSLEYLTAGSPLFARYRGQTRWLRRGNRALWLTQALVILGVIALMVGAASLLAVLNARYTTYRIPGMGLLQAYVAISMLMMVISVPLALLSDFVCMSAALRQTKRDSLFDMVRLTRLSNRGIIVSHFAAARLRVWRGMSLVFAVRLVAVVTFIVVQYWLVPQAENAYLYNGGTALTPLTPFNLLIQIGISLCLGIAFVMEAHWRLNGVTARAVVVAVSREGDIPREFVALFSLLRLWIMQVISLTIFMFLLIAAGVVVIGILTNWTEDVVVRVIGGSLLLLLFALTILYFVRQHYRTMIQRELRRAERIAFMPDP